MASGKTDHPGRALAFSAARLFRRRAVGLREPPSPKYSKIKIPRLSEKIFKNPRDIYRQSLWINRDFDIIVDWFLIEHVLLKNEGACRSGWNILIIYC